MPKEAPSPNPSPATAASPIPWTNLAASDVRLVVSDMDGTLLDGDNRIPAAFWPLLDVMLERGITFVPASGRQHAMLRRMFPERRGVSFIAENGNIVIHEDRVLAATALPRDLMLRVIDMVRRSGEVGLDLGLVVCGHRSAYIERTDDAFVGEAAKYYARLEEVEDLADVTDQVAKLAIFDFDSAEASARRTFGEIATEYQVVVSGKHWTDIQDPQVDKGIGVRRLQEALGVTASQTVVFGDYLNDLEMMGEAEFSVAVANAHPGVRGAARYLAPSNVEGGVIRVLHRLLGLGPVPAE